MTEQLATKAAVETVAAAEQPAATGVAAGGAVGEAAAAAEQAAGEVSIRQIRPGAEENRIVRDVWISGYRSYSENPCNDPPSTEGEQEGGGWGWRRPERPSGCVCVLHSERMLAGFCSHWAPDMDAIYETHLGPGRGGNFLIAECGGEIIGCVGAMPHDPLTCELHRMSVSGRSHRKVSKPAGQHLQHHYQRHYQQRDELCCRLPISSVLRLVITQGVGRLLVDRLESWARGQGFAQVFLTTWAGSCTGTRKPGTFYERLGYQLVQDNRPRVYLKVLDEAALRAAQEAMREERARRQQQQQGEAAAAAGSSSSEEEDNGSDSEDVSLATAAVEAQPTTNGSNEASAGSEHQQQSGEQGETQEGEAKEEDDDNEEEVFHDAEEGNGTLTA
jgi:N-acetylglutamate synthase-like GNAT family acetyltransferase